MNTSTNPKRKRSSVEPAVGHGIAEDDEGNSKSRKLFMAAEPGSVDTSISTDIRNTSSFVGIGPITPLSVQPVIIEPRYIETAPIDNITTSAHKQILQQQWTAEAHGQLLACYAERAVRLGKMGEESIGTDILSDDHNHSSDTQTDVVSNDGKKHESKKSAGLLNTPSKMIVQMQPKTSSIKAAPLPRATFHQPDGSSSSSSSSSSNVGVPGFSVVDHDSVQGTGNVASCSFDSVADVGTVNSATVTASTIVPIPTVAEVESDGDTQSPEIASVKKRDRRSVFFRLLILGFFAIIVAFISLNRWPARSLDSSRDILVAEEAMIIDDTPLQLVSEVEEKIISHSTQLMQQLSGLEQEASLLSVILDRAAASEAEAKALQEKAKEDQAEFEEMTETSFRDIEEFILELEEKCIVAAEMGQTLDSEIDGIFDAVTEKTSTSERLTSLEDEGEQLDDAVQRLEAEVLSAASAPIPDVLDDAAELVALADVDLESVAIASSKNESGEEQLKITSNGTQTTGIDTEPTPAVSPEDAERDAAISGAVSRAEEMLASLEQELSESAKDIDLLVRGHVSVLAEVTYIRAATEAAAIAAAATAAAVAAASIASDAEVATKEVRVERAVGSSSVLAPASVMASSLHPHHLDYAVWPRGGRVVPPGVTVVHNEETLDLTSPPYLLSLGPLKRLRYKLHLDREDADESVLVSHSSAGAGYSREGNGQSQGQGPHSCYAFAGSTGSVTVTMHSPVKVSSVQILYTPRPGEEHRDSAPRQFRLIGWPEVPSAAFQLEGSDLGSFEYSISEVDYEGDSKASGLQTFSVPSNESNAAAAYRAVTVTVLSNHGDPGYTSICRVKVLGELLQSAPASDK